MKQFVKTPLFPFAVTAAVYLLMYLWGISGITGDEMGYSLLCFFIVSPILELVCGFFIGRKRTWLKWLYLLTGILNWVLAMLVFMREKPIFSEFVMLTALAAGFAMIGVVSGKLSKKRN
jgi:peptidoglycan/LPS O-acetylase OafA/YrhL